MSGNQSAKLNKPWFVNEEGDITDGEYLVAEVNYLKLGSHKTANLLAAAPELLAACQSVINWFNSTGGHVLGLSEELEAAIAKAKGE